MGADEPDACGLHRKSSRCWSTTLRGSQQPSSFGALLKMMQTYRTLKRLQWGSRDALLPGRGGEDSAPKRQRPEKSASIDHDDQ